MATIIDLINALNEHLEILDEKYKEARDIDEALNALHFDNKSYVDWINEINTFLDNHESQTNPHELNTSQLNAYNKSEIDVPILKRMTLTDLPISLVKIGNDASLTNINIPQDFSDSNKLFDYDTGIFTINESHFLLNGKYRKIENTSGDINTVSDLLILTSDLENNLTALPTNFRSYLIFDNNQIKILLQNESETELVESETTLWLFNGQIDENSITIETSSWFMRIGNYRISPNDNTLKGSSIPFSSI